jgi:hypothetical protein
MLRTEENGFFVSTLDFDAVSFDCGVILQGIVDDAAIECAEGFQFHHIAPTPDFLGGFHRLFDQCIPGLRSVTADVHHDFRGGLIQPTEKAIREVLEITQRLALPSDKPPGIVRLNFEEEAIVHLVFFDDSFEPERLEELFEDGLGLRGHNGSLNWRKETALLVFPWSRRFGRRACRGARSGLGGITLRQLHLGDC